MHANIVQALTADDEAAREFRDRYLEEVNSGRLLPGGGLHGGLQVRREPAVGGSANSG